MPKRRGRRRTGRRGPPRANGVTGVQAAVATLLAAAPCVALAAQFYRAKQGRHVHIPLGLIGLAVILLGFSVFTLVSWWRSRGR